MRYVLDTNIVAALLNANPLVVGRLASLPERDIAVPIVVLAELLFGAYRSSRTASNTQRVRAVASRVEILAADFEVFERYAAVRAALADVGRPKSDFDLVIACTAMAHNATLVTHDDALLDGSIPGLVVEDWLKS